MRRSELIRLGAVCVLSQLFTITHEPAAAAGWDSTVAEGTSQQASPAPATAAGQSELRGKLAEPKVVSSPQAEIIRKDRGTAYRMAKDPWLYKTAAADPSILAAICEHSGAARLLAKNRHLGDLAESDHYLCRRLTQWHGATYALIKNPQADRVIVLDPEGIYRAIQRDPHVAHVLAKNIMFNQMIVENPELGKFIANHM